jgi:hypothetical protein
VRLVVGKTGVFPDRLADHLGTLALDLLEPVADGGLVAQVRLEHQPVGLALAAHVLEVGAERGGDPLLGIGVRAERVAHSLHQGVHALVEQRQVELELAGEVLVEHGLADARAVGDLIHRGGVIPLGYEHLERRVQ